MKLSYIKHHIKDISLNLLIMKKIYILLLLFSWLIFSSATSADKNIYNVTGKGTKVYVVKYDYQADIKVFVCDYDYQADLKVYKVKYDYQANDDGKWYFTDYDYQADKKIFFTDYDYQADLKIYFVDYDYQAGWNNKSKMHLMY